MGGRRKCRGITMRDVARQGSNNIPSGTTIVAGDDDDETQPPSQPLDILHETLVPEMEIGSDVEIPCKRRGRGATRIHEQWNTGKKFEVEWDAIKKVVTGKDIAAVVSSVGILARNTFRFPLNYPSYTDLKDLDLLWSEVQENTGLPTEANYFILRDFGNAWKAWKCKVKKKYFKPNKDSPGLIGLCPPIMDTEQWKELVEYWLRDDIEKISDQNRNNQKMNLFPHRTGRTPFEVIINEMKKAGESTSQMDVFKRSRRTPPNKPKNSNTEAVIEEMDNRVVTSLPGNEDMAKKEAWIEIHGPERHGRVRCAAKGVTPTQYQSIGLPQSLSEIPSPLIEKISGLVRKEFDDNYRERVRAEIAEEFDENYRERVRAEIEENFETMLQRRVRAIHGSLDTFSMPSENTQG